MEAQKTSKELSKMSRGQLERAIDEAGARGDIERLELVQLEVARRYGKNTTVGAK